MSMINDNSIDMLRHSAVINPATMTDVGENTMDVMVRRGPPPLMYEGSMDVNVGNSSLAALSEDGSCNSIVHPMMKQPHVVDEIKGMDLRMKMPMATVADLVNTTAPSLATLHRFGVTEASSVPLPAQSAQSVENYLTTLETTNKNALSDIEIKDKIAQIVNNEQTNILAQSLPHLAAAQNEELISKLEAAATTEPNIPAPINTEKLDALVNSAVETHIGSPTTESNCSPKRNAPPEIIITSQDVMLNTQPTLMVPPVINTALSSPNINPQETALHPHNSPSIAPEVILNSQISPSIMCRNTEGLSQDSLLPNPIDSNLALHSSIPNLVASAEAEKAILFKATVDLLQTQKQISDLERKLSPTENKVHMMGDFLSAGSGYVQNQFGSPPRGGVSPNMKSTTEGGPVIPVPVKEMAGVSAGPQDKKNEDRMIPSAFATMSESDLINIINPSCFDQGNNFQ